MDIMPSTVAPPHPPQPATGSLYRHTLLYATFAATGVALALPGALMPWLLAHWAMRDSQAGLFLFLFFFASTGGAMLSRGSLTASIARGTACTALGAALLPFASRSTSYLAIVLYGLGLGITMTSTSLLQSRRYAADCAPEMTRLNLLWAIGACTGPWLVLHDGVLDGTHAQHVLLALALAFGLFAILILAFEKNIPAPVRTHTKASRFTLLAAPFPLLLLIFCATGVESSAGSWLATYAHRSGESLGITIGAPTCFWAGLLASRILQSSSRISHIARRSLLTWNLVAMTAALTGLIFFHEGLLMLTAAFIVGFAAGPMYPLLLALIFEHDSSNMIFVLAGLGSAALPFLTGTLSTAANSLRSGLLVPAAAAAAMAIAGWSTSRNKQNPTST